MKYKLSLCISQNSITSYVSLHKTMNNLEKAYSTDSKATNLASYLGLSLGSVMGGHYNKDIIIHRFNSLT